MRVGIFGGSFDPVHYGHLILAEQCREQAELSQVLFIPAAQSPLKEKRPTATDKQRLEMLSLAIAGHRHFAVSTVEIDRGGTSYTVDTLGQLQETSPDNQYFLLIGEDSLATFDRWKSPEEICRLAMPLVVRRPTGENGGNDATVDLSMLASFMEQESLRQAHDHAITSRLIDISGTDIRNRVGLQKSVSYLLPRAVEKYIETNKLYISN